MRNLARPLLRLLGQDERGAVGVLIAVLLGCGVLLGMGALTIDVGQIYQNRAELQNGADAAALAVARQCAQGNCASGSAMSTALTYANDNASALTQGTAGVSVICGSDNLGSCASVVGSGLTNCPQDPTDSSTHFVDVQTETDVGNKSTLLPPVFAETLVGRSTYNGTTVKACAQAEWGPSGGLAFTISACEWYVATGGSGSQATTGSRYWNPQNLPPDPSLDTQFLMHSGNGNSPDTTCNDGPAGQDAPGAFGWTADNGSCQTVISNNTYYDKPGNSATGDCQTVLAQLVASNTPVSVPVYSSVGGQGSHSLYAFQGFATLVITGFSVPGDSVTDTFNPTVWSMCGSSDTCIDGYLTTNILSQTPLGGSSGPTNVKLTG